MTHELKILRGFYSPIISGEKKFEIIKNDRDFKTWDKLWLRVFEPETGEYSGRNCTCTITYITDFEQKPGFVVMGISVDNFSTFEP